MIRISQNVRNWKLNFSFSHWAQLFKFVLQTAGSNLANQRKESWYCRFCRKHFECYSNWGRGPIIFVVYLYVFSFFCPLILCWSKRKYNKSFCPQKYNFSPRLISLRKMCENLDPIAPGTRPEPWRTDCIEFGKMVILDDDIDDDLEYQENEHVQM